MGRDRISRDETRRDNETRKDKNSRQIRDRKMHFETRQDFKVLQKLYSRQDKTSNFFKMSGRDGTRQHFPTCPGREIGTGNFPTHH